MGSMKFLLIITNLSHLRLLEYNRIDGKIAVSAKNFIDHWACNTTA